MIRMFLQLSSKIFMAKLPPLIIFILLRSLASAATAASPPQFEGFDAEDVEEDISVLPAASNSDLTLLSPSAPPFPTAPPATSAPTPTPPPVESTFEYWDEDEFEGFPLPNSHSHPEEVTPHASSQPDSNENPPEELGPGLGLGLRSYYMEIACVAFLIIFVINYFKGKSENEKLALTWAKRFAARNSIFDKNFNILGLGEGDGDNSPLLLKEGNTVYKFYATGRRFCQGLVCTLELKSRHDLLSRVYSHVVRCKDEITVEVFMNDDAMDNVVFALAKSKVAKAMHKEERDLQRFCGLVAPPVGRKWLADGLAVVGESKEVAGDLITEAVLDQVFGDKAFEKFGKFFISMHFSDQHIGSHKKMLVFKFSIPGTNDMADMTRLVALIPYYIDLIGRYKLSSHARSKTQAGRQKVAEEIHKELLTARQEDLKKRKVELRKKMEEAEAKLGAEFLRRKESKKSAPKIKMNRAY